jgi:hypothetical protein
MFAVSSLLRAPVRVEVPPSISEEDHHPRSRAYLVSQILELNPTATIEFLSSFSEDSLREYLDHLHSAHEPRGGASRWIRREGRCAVVWRPARAS